MSEKAEVLALEMRRSNRLAMAGLLFAAFGVTAAVVAISVWAIRGSGARGVHVTLYPPEFEAEQAPEEAFEVIDLKKLPLEEERRSAAPVRVGRSTAKTPSEEVDPTPWRVYLEESDETDPSEEAERAALYDAATFAAQHGRPPPGVAIRLEETPAPDTGNIPGPSLEAGKPQEPQGPEDLDLSAIAADLPEAYR